MAISEELKLEIKYRNDIETVVSSYVNLKRAGKNLVGLCPFHSEKTPSFTVYPENGSFYCFGCHVGGDVIGFVRLIENLDYVEAVKLLADRAGLSLPEDSYDDSMQKLRTRLLGANREAARFFHNYLLTPGGKWALDYLTGRGLTMQTIRHFGLGAAPDGWDDLTRYLTGKGYTSAELLQAGLVGRSKRDTCYDFFRRRVMFPILDVRGNVVAFSGRAAPGEDSTRKYFNTGDTPVFQKGKNLFALNFAKSHCAERVILVEGNMDVVSLHQAGFENTVAPLGTAFKTDQARLLGRYTKEIVITLDADTAGRDAVRRTISILREAGIPARVLSLPDCKDPDEFIQKHGAARFRALLDGAVSDIEYRLFSAAEGLDLNADADKLKYLTRAAEVLADTDDAMARDLYESRLAETCGVSKTAISARVSQLRESKRSRRHTQEIREVIAPRISREDVNPEKREHLRAARAEETLLQLLMQHPDCFETVAAILPPEQMVTTFNRRAYTALSRILSAGYAADLTLLGEEFTPAELGSLIALQNGTPVEGDVKRLAQDCVGVIQQEKAKADAPNAAQLPTEDWAAQMQRIAQNKTGSV